MLSTITALLLAGVLPGHAGKKDVVQDGVLEVPLKGYPEPPTTRPPTTAPGPRDRTQGAGQVPAGRMTAFSRPGADFSGVVGRLGTTIAPSTDIYRRRDPRSGILNRLPYGYYFAVKGAQGGYYAVLMIDGSLGWVPATSVQLLEYDIVAEPQRPGQSPFNPNLDRLVSAVLAEAYKYLGVPYRWGGNGARGIDCSGLVRNVFARCGVPLPRTAHEQARFGSPVAVNELRAGDRLYFSVNHRSIDHTGIYIGSGYFIHASMSRGEVGVDRLAKPLYGANLVQARRF